MITMVRKTFFQEAPSRGDLFVNAVGIFAAAESGDAERMRQIIKVKSELSNINYPYTVSEQKPIHSAVREGHVEVVQLLLEASVDPLGNYHHNHYIPCALYCGPQQRTDRSCGVNRTASAQST